MQYDVIMMRSCTDQGDTLSPDWLGLKVLIETQGYCLIPIKFAFALLTTAHPPSLMAFHNIHGSGCDHFTCSAPWQHKKVSRFDNTKYTMSAINAHQPYPTAYQVGTMEMWAMCCWLTTVSLDLSALSSWIYPIRRGEPLSDSKAVPMEQRHLSRV